MTTRKLASPAPPIAVVGVSALFPGSTDARGFWHDILAAKDLIMDVPESHWLIEDYYNPDPSAPDKTYCKRGAFLSDTPFDCMAFGTPPNLVPATDTVQLLALIVAQKVLEDACRGPFEHLDKSRVSCILGATGTTELVVHLGSRLQRPVWLRALRDSGVPEDEAQAICDRIAAQYLPWQEASFPGLLGNVVAGRIANRFDLGGTNCIVDAACASSLSALAMGLNELYLGQADMCITGGVDTLNDIMMYMCFSKTPALSPTGDCRPFSDQADGTVLGEGLGMVALRRLEDAERDGDHIYAVLRGIGTSSDGRSKSIYAPRPEGQAVALERCYEVAGYGPETVEFVEAHGTGTKAGDASEFESLSLVFDGRGREDRRWCALGSIKSQIGHTKGAAGAASLFKAVMALHHKILPPTIKVERPNPELDVAASPFYINTEARPWIRDSTYPRRASVSSFGFGGTNFHVTLEEYPQTRPSWRFRPAPTELVIVTGETPAVLCDTARTLTKGLLEAENGLALLSRQSLRSFDASAPARLAVVAENMADLQRKLDMAVAAIATSPHEAQNSPVGWWYGHGVRSGKLAFLFPGQGSQYRFMGADLAMAFDCVREVWDRASERPLDEKVRLHERVFPIAVFSDGDRKAQEAALTATEWAQPAIGVSSLSLLALVRALGLKPDCVGGHSFGEVTALCAAGVLDEAGLLSVARQRGELMAEAAVRPGAMTAVSHTADELRALLAEWHSDVVLANHNSPRQSVLSGRTEAIAEVETKLEEAGIRFRRLPVATAFHSEIVSPASGPFKDFLGGVDFGEARIPVYANSQAAPYPEDADAKRSILAEAIAKPVRFVEQIEAMAAAGVETFLEVGPNNVLTKLVDAILGERALGVALDCQGRSGLTSLWHALGQLTARGFALDFAPLLEPLAPLEDPRTKPQAHLTVSLSGVNYAKPYPPKGGASALPPPNPPRPAREAAESTTGMHIPASLQQQEAIQAHNGYAAAPKPAPQAPAASRASPAPAEPPPAAPPPNPTMPAGAATGMGAGESLQWVEAFQNLQQQTTDAHMAFLRVAERSLIGLEALLTSHPATASPNAASPATRVPSVPAPAATESASAPTAFDSPPVEPASAMPSAPVVPSVDLTALMLAVVSEKTGYPEDMLELELELESDLGIDSIKRVEILAAIQERVPSLPEVAPAELATLRTLGAIVDFMDAGGAQSDEGREGNGSRPVAPTAAGAPVQRFEVEFAKRAPSGFSLPHLFDGERVFITDEGTGVAAALAEILRQRGIAAELCVGVPAAARVVIALDGLRQVANEDEALAVNRAAFLLATRLAPSFEAGGGTLVFVQDTGGDFGASAAGVRVWLGGLTGLAKTAALEWPEATLRAIDLERGECSAPELAATLAEELFQGGSEREVGLRANGERCVPVVEVAAARSGPARVDESSVIVASGGARGVTAASLIALARAARPRIVLLGRTALEDEPVCCAGIEDDAELKKALLLDAGVRGEQPSPIEIGRLAARIRAMREVRATITQLEAAGSKVLYRSCDVSDRSSVVAALTQARERFGPITGLVHGAGILADKRLTEKTEEHFDRVFGAKVLGLRTLLEATADDPLTVLVFYSSVAARAGNTGQSDYAMANEILNRVAQREARRRPEARVCSIGWGPWKSGMVTPALETMFHERGIALISLDEGAAHFVNECQGHGATEIIIGGAADAEALVRVDTTRIRRFEVVVSAASHPYLRSHQIQDVPVLPLVLVQEWFVRAVRAVNPDAGFVLCRDFRVLQGIRLTRLESGEHFIVQLEEGQGEVGLRRFALALLDGEGQRRYSASIEMRDQAPTPAAARAPVLAETRPTSEFYGPRLFHGPDFRSLKDVVSFGDEGATAELIGTLDLGWPGGPWQTDPALIDGGLQLARVWGYERLGRPTLPTQVTELALYVSGPLTEAGPVRCCLSGCPIGKAGTRTDLVFVSGDGRVLAELRGLEMHAMLTEGSEAPAPAVRG
jgi:acyl transferase domain-containing protein/NAD(P)-dependent dehydrogenase (short-subunit alcohol dehydrogenase family)